MFTTDVVTVFVGVDLRWFNVRTAVWIVRVFRVWFVRVFSARSVNRYGVGNHVVVVTDRQVVSVLVGCVIVKDTTDYCEVRRIVVFIEVRIVFVCFTVVKNNFQDVLSLVEANNVVSTVAFFSFSRFKVYLVTRRKSVSDNVSAFLDRFTTSFFNVCDKVELND